MNFLAVKTLRRQAALSPSRKGSSLFLALVVIAFACSAQAAPIFSQTHTPYTASIGSDVDAIWAEGAQVFDDLTLASSATVQSVTWWGILGFEDTPVTPVSFELIFYRDAGGLPDTGNVISSTTVSFTSLTGTGFEINGDDVYEFQANVTPTVLPGGTKVWFSVLADTSNDNDDDFLWAVEWFQDAGSGTTAHRAPLSETEPFDVFNGMQLFVLDDAPVSEPPQGIVSSFTAIGGDVFELTLEGKSSAAYEFRSSTDLVFEPGTLVTDLTQGKPSDPGTIGGPNNSMVTTDGDGIATVRMNLTGSKNFVRAQGTE
jgi:hypothetical protein